MKKMKFLFVITTTSFLFLIACENDDYKDEKFINTLIHNKQFKIENLSNKPVKNSEFLPDFDDGFLERYNFKNIVYEVSLLNIDKIKYSRTKNDIVTYISRPIYSEDKKFCMINVRTQNHVGTALSDTIYIFRQDKKLWLIESKVVDFISH